MKLTAADRRLLDALDEGPRAVEDLAEVREQAPDHLSERLEALADNGLVVALEDGRYRRTESGRRLLRTAGGLADEAVDTDPAVEAAIADAASDPDVADAIRATYAFLRYWGDATVDELIDGLHSEWPAGHEAGDEWWGTVGDALDALPNVEPPAGFESDDVASDDGGAEAGGADGAGTDDALETWRFDGTPEVATPAADGFLPAERRGHPRYGSVRHAVASLDLTDDERTAVRAAFGELRRRGAASEDAIAEAAFTAHPLGRESADEWWTTLVGDAFEELPGVDPGGDGWRYEPGPTE